MIGDAPVSTVKPGSIGVGRHQGVALGEATLVYMPISPEVLIALGPEAAETTIGRERVL